MKNQLILALELILCTSVFAGNENYPAGARSASMATASVSLTDLWSSFNNQAGLSYLENPSAGFYYENRFMVKEYALQAGTIAAPLKPGTLAVNYRYFGYSKYHESKFGLAFARKLHKNISAGIQLNYHQNYLAESYGNRNALTVELGLIYNPVENLTIGAHVFNPNRVKFKNDYEEYIPTLYRVGASYQVLKKATLVIETEKDIDRDAVFKGGLEIMATKNLDFRFGLGSDYIGYSFGLGYHNRRMALDLAFSHHNILGFTPHVSFSFNSGKS